MARPLHQNETRNKILHIIVSLYQKKNGAVVRKDVITECMKIGIPEKTMDYHIKQLYAKELITTYTETYSYYTPTQKALDLYQSPEQSQPTYHVLSRKTFFTETKDSIDCCRQEKILVLSRSDYHGTFSDSKYTINPETIQIYEQKNDKKINIPIVKLEKDKERNFVKPFFTLDEGEHDIFFLCKFHLDKSFNIKLTERKHVYYVLKTLNSQKIPPLLTIYDTKNEGVKPIELKKLSDKEWLLDRLLPAGIYVCHWDLSPPQQPNP